MALRMPSPTKHQKTHVYYLNVRVPADLVRAGRRPVVKESLRTKDPVTAKRLFALRYEELQREWQAERDGPAAVPLARLMSLAGEWRRELDTMLEAEPGEPSLWEVLRAKTDVSDLTTERLEAALGADANRLLRRAGLNADAYSRERFLKLLDGVWSEWAAFQHRRSLGDFRPDPLSDRYPTWSPPEPAPEAASLTITEAFTLWERDHLANGKSEKTARDFRQKLDSLRAFVGHDDAAKVTPENVAAWCDDLRHNQGISARTVSQKYLAAAKVVFVIAVEKRKLGASPVADVKVRYAKRVRARDPGFSDAEAKAILSAALANPESLGRRSEDNKRAIRWGPWICAFTGARVGEAMQLRREDLQWETVDGTPVPCLRITPEAGTVKTGKFRFVPVHPQLQEMGLVNMIEQRPAGPLFFSPSGNAITKARNAGAKVGEWVREVVGIDDPLVQPNHAWRHRFKTVAKDADIPPEYCEAIQGHEDGRAASAYGTTSVKTLWREIQKLPRYPVKFPMGSPSG